MRGERTNRREYDLYRAMRAVGRAMPFGVLQRVGAALGVVFLLASSRRRTVLRNLARVYPERGLWFRVATALRCAAHFGRITFDFIKWSHATGDVIRAKVRCEGVENIAEAVRRGKGCFVLSAHFGHWEVAAQWLALNGFPQGMVYRPLENPLMEEELARSRTRFGNTLIPKEGATRGIMKTIRDGGIVDILLDQKADLEHSVIVTFLGVATPTTPSLAKIALATGAAVVPLFSYPEGTGYRFRLDPPVPVGPGDTITTLTQRYNDAVSREIFANPRLWFWFHDRWTPRKRKSTGL
ncbi:MAG TPA: lysophospholipid acyltransferase family protein [Thermoanaerobaculaceae bacterium]|nr:lysophospholipid acyltransferase family protein [Thermoanaerobaculaceae bacterium]